MIGSIGLYALYRQLLPSNQYPDPKLYKIVWGIQKTIPLVIICETVMWNVGKFIFILYYCILYTILYYRHCYLPYYTMLYILYNIVYSVILYILYYILYPYYTYYYHTLYYYYYYFLTLLLLHYR